MVLLRPRTRPATAVATRAWPWPAAALLDAVAAGPAPDAFAVVLPAPVVAAAVEAAAGDAEDGVGDATPPMTLAVFAPRAAPRAQRVGVTAAASETAGDGASATPDGVEAMRRRLGGLLVAPGARFSIRLPGAETAGVWTVRSLHRALPASSPHTPC